MPLRDHFHTNSTRFVWQGLQSGWPVVMVQRLNSMLPGEYVASPFIHVGSTTEFAFTLFEPESVATWALAKPAVLLETEFPEPSEYEVRIYTQDEYRLVAAIELVSPSNKDRPENRQTFVNKCEAMLKKGVCVTIVDLVTTRIPNLYGELLDELGAPRTAVANSLIYATTCRAERSGLRWRLVAWEHELAIGGVMPTLPIWLSKDFLVPLELESTYEDSCRALRIR
jgi:hypothetical protein